MKTLKDYLEESREEIETEAEQYAKSYNCSYDVALRDVRDEYIGGYASAVESLRSGDWDYGRE